MIHEPFRNVVYNSLVRRPTPLRRRVALVTSGLGMEYGGIGVVAKSIKTALDPTCDVSVWQHPPFWPRSVRVARVAVQVFIGSSLTVKGLPWMVLPSWTSSPCLPNLFPTGLRFDSQNGRTK